MIKKDLLLEIGTEELPPKALLSLANAFVSSITGDLDSLGLHYASTTTYATPRRIAIIVNQLDAFQADQIVEKRGPAVTAAFDENNQPTKATLGFARSCNAEVDELQRLTTAKGEWLSFRQTVAGKESEKLIPQIFKDALNALPVPKRMRWGSLKDAFVRPVHWIVAIFDHQIIPITLYSTESSNVTYGHRFHHPEGITIPSPSQYETLLEKEGKVIADFSKRREIICSEVTQLASSVNATVTYDGSLLDEITSLVEWPVAILGNFDKQYLSNPPECNIAVMRGHQKYFHLTDSDGNLLPHFVTISNISSSSPQTVRIGNERVIHPRLADAAFFWQQDCKQTLQFRLELLKNVIFQQQVGTIFDKTERITALATSIALHLQLDVAAVEEAAQLCKADLVSAMVGEFPELQGTMGRYYALNQGLSLTVATAIEEHYLPRFSGDHLPTDPVSSVIGIADRLDTLVAIFAIGQKPSGTKDPFALRRSSLALLRLIIENNLDLDLKLLLECAANALSEQLDSGVVGEGPIPVLADDALIDQVFNYIMDRLVSYFLDQGYSTHIIQAVVSDCPTRPVIIAKKIDAVAKFITLEEAEPLAAANKRIGNILKKAETEIPDSYDHQLFLNSAENKLAEELEQLTKEIDPLIIDHRYSDALVQLAKLRPVVDLFFTEVMVNVEDSAVRNNRLALLNQLQLITNKIANLSYL
ncbi:MAG: glycine--tRNA ligase subunit beta [Gammaproteobacteria bacterium]|nr:glycine--tRNA ligase subunit beta [Gammaproteobacteria bacterium]